MNWHVVFAISLLVIIATSIILVMGFKMEHHDYKGLGLFFDFLFEFHEIIMLLICALVFFIISICKLYNRELGILQKMIG